MGCINSKCANQEEVNRVKNRRTGPPPRGIRRIANLFRKTRIQHLNIPPSDDSPHNSNQDPPENERASVAEPIATKETQGEEGQSNRDCLEENSGQPSTSTCTNGVTESALQDFVPNAMDGRLPSPACSDRNTQAERPSSMPPDDDGKPAAEKTTNPKKVSFSGELEEVVTFSKSPEEEERQKRDIVVILPSCETEEEEEEVNPTPATSPSKKSPAATGARPSTALPISPSKKAPAASGARPRTPLPTSQPKTSVLKDKKKKKGKKASVAERPLSSTKQIRPKSSRANTSKEKNKSIEMAYKWKKVQKWMKRFTDTVEKEESKPNKHQRAKSAPVIRSAQEACCSNTSSRRSRIRLWDMDRDVVTLMMIQEEDEDPYPRGDEEEEGEKLDQEEAANREQQIKEGIKKGVWRRPMRGNSKLKKASRRALGGGRLEGTAN
ncbi:nucleolar protein dao-5-like [Saccostrea cucullata]|uniref:nucleolar protein dao-5-like n=1 Tax=Saccostrea cuccullata TaxID=36930 RepID=UPI002ED02C07